VTIVHFQRSAWDDSAPATESVAVGGNVIRVTRERPFADAWNGALHRGGRLRAIR
jgi:hypothetical protein